MSNKQHWDTIFQQKAPHELSWFQPQAEVSLQLVKQSGIDQEASIIDVGGGTSGFIGELLAEGFQNLTVLDISSVALDVAKKQLGCLEATVQWINESVLEATLPSHEFDLWHDRATFHFLVDQHDRDRYVEQLTKAIKPGGYVIIASFAIDGPTMCSQLPVVRYDAIRLHKQLGTSFTLITQIAETHTTPSGTAQNFLYCLFQNKK